ncbi:MAG: SusC/RagA family TonB-linked outer membrane protein [Bacteroidales bacterium]|nr:SusC/RagA family TonB-linked outer membrane protein [Bacteroides sp.]MCM1197850.1 SusC/RagA family TonB-linked outer membrane protein [Clostridium sp.]MCM1503315.1 SusC/RagA family TonB-linked outer membrane protein [Bacteroidales bacterium]
MNFFHIFREAVSRTAGHIIVCVLLCLWSIQAGAQTERVTFSLKDATLVELIKAIEAGSVYNFVYNNSEISPDIRVTVNAENETVKSLLGKYLGDFVPKVEGKTIVLTSRKNTSAKPITVKGHVTDETGEPMIGVGVTSFSGKTRVGTMTGNDGAWSMQVPSNATLEFSFLGYTVQNIPVNSRGVINVQMVPDRNELDAVVVTALGLTREEKSVGYAIGKVDGAAVNNSVSSNWLNNMSGKVAGLNFDHASAGPGGSVRATLRGEASLSYDNNSALFVVDGVPIYTDMEASNSGSVAFNTDAPIDYGNGASDINPEDIESISVLKGPAATALYGSRAANGAILITTKSGRATKGIGVTFSSSVSFEQAGYWPDFQTQYGAGNGNAGNLQQQRFYNYWSVPAAAASDGIASTGRVYSRTGWGAKFDGQMFYQYESRDWETGMYTKLPWIYRDWYKGFFETGTTYVNSVAISANTGKGTSMRFSIKDNRNSWIVPNTGYTSQSFSASVKSKINNFITLNLKANYFRKDSDNLPMSGYNAASPLYTLIWNPNVIDIQSYWNEYSNGRIKQMYEENTPSYLINSTYADNIYMQVYEQLNSMDRDRVYGTADVTFNIWKEKLTLRVKSGIDMNMEFRTQRKPFHSNGYQYGYYKEQTIRNFEMNNEFLLTYKDQFGDFSINASFGGNDYAKNYQAITLATPDGLLYEEYVMANSRAEVKPVTTRSNKRVESLFGIISLAWKNMIFLDITGRNDWSSTLAPGNNSYFYPSIGGSIMVNELFRFSEKAPWFNMLKVRGTWANVGNDTNPYQIVQTYINSQFNGTFHLNTSIKNYNLKPENIESWEVGLETKFLDNRIGLDIAWYDSKTTNQIINVPIDYATGASSRVVNAGCVTNKGIEISASFNPIRTKDWNWRIDLNWSKNWNRLVELAEGVDLWQMNSSLTVSGNIYIYAMPGTELGRLYGRGYERAPEGAFYIDSEGNKIDCSGQVIVNRSTGNPELSSAENVLDNDFGSIYPDWNGGFSTSLTWKNLSFNAAFSYQWGGKTYSMTHFALAYQGKLNNSLEGRYAGLIHPGVNLNADGTYSKNTTITTDVVDYYNTYVYARENAENNIFDTSFLKCTEMRLDYSLPKRICEKTKVLQGVSLGIFVSNPFCITKFPMYDPEAGTLVGSSVKRGIEAGAYPMTRSYGLNLKLSF